MRTCYFVGDKTNGIDLITIISDMFYGSSNKWCCVSCFTWTNIKSLKF